MNKRKKHLIDFELLILTVILTTGLRQSAVAQVDPCSKPNVAVVMEIIEVNEGEFFNHLNEQYPSQPKGSWICQIQEKVLEELRMNSPGTQFIPATGEVPNDCDYYFQCTFNLRGAGEDIEVTGLLHSEYTAYFMSSRLCQNTACGIQSSCLNTQTTLNRDIDKTIEQNIAAHGNIGNRIKKHEESHRVPPRGPEMEVSQDRDYISPLKEERKLKIKINVKNCKGEPVYDPNHGQLVILPKKTERGELKCTNGFPEGCMQTSNLLTLIIQTPKGASATYTLKKGVTAKEDPIEILTCGIDKKVVKETKIQIHGLELKVEPEKKEIFPGDETKITIKLSEVDTKGTKQPVAGKRIQLKISGLIDGHVYPPGESTTDQSGEAILTYNAGDKDKKVVIKAKFQPKDYPESVKDETAITVAHYEGRLEMTYRASEVSCTEGSATVLVNFGKQDYSFLSGPDQMSVYCPVESINIVEAKAINNCAEPPQIGQGFHPYYEIPLPPGEKPYLIFLKNTVSEKITHLLVNSCGPCIILGYTCSDGSKGLLGPIITNDDYKVTGGDGINNGSGGQGMIHWKFHLRKGL